MQFKFMSSVYNTIVLAQLGSKTEHFHLPQQMLVFLSQYVFLVSPPTFLSVFLMELKTCRSV